MFTDIKVRPDLTLRSGGNLAVAFRKENPKLREVVNTWLRKHAKGDAFRNTIEQRYLKSVKYAKNAAADAEQKKLQAVVGLFKKYGAQYNLDYLLWRSLPTLTGASLVLSRWLEAFTSSSNDGSCRLLWARSLTRDWTVSGNVLFTRTSDAAGRFWDNGVMVGMTRALTSTVSAFAEVSSVLLAERPGRVDAGRRSGLRRLA